MSAPPLPTTPTVMPMADDRPLRVMVVEDDPSITRLIETALTKAGHDVTTVATAAGALDIVGSSPPDVILLDLGLPDRDGVEVLRAVRSDHSAAGVGVICVTARTEEIDRVLGFELGADDYVTKPFSPRELAGRVRALGRRLRSDAPGGHAVPDDEPESDNTVVVGELMVDFARREVLVAGTAVAVTPMERRLIEYLVTNRGLALSRLQILESVWGHDWLGDSRTVDMHIAQIRKKLDTAVVITTVRGIGYRME